MSKRKGIEFNSPGVHENIIDELEDIESMMNDNVKIVHAPVKSKEEVSEEIIKYMTISKLLSGGNGIRRGAVPKKHRRAVNELKKAIIGVLGTWIELGLIKNVR